MNGSTKPSHILFDHLSDFALSTSHFLHKKRPIHGTSLRFSVWSGVWALIGSVGTQNTRMIESPSPPFVDRELFDLRESQNRNSSLWADFHGEDWMAGTPTPFLPQWRPSTYPKGAPCVVPVLKELIWDAVTEVLSALQNLFIEGFQRSGPVNVALGSSSLRESSLVTP